MSKDLEELDRLYLKTSIRGAWMLILFSEYKICYCEAQIVPG